MKYLQNYNVKEMTIKELKSSNGGGIGVWIAQAIDAAQGAVHDLFAGQYNHVRNAMEK